MFLWGYFEARAVPQASSECGHAEGCAGGAEGCCAPKRGCCSGRGCLAPTSQLGSHPWHGLRRPAANHTWYRNSFLQQLSYRSHRIGSGISAVATHSQYFQFLITSSVPDLPFLGTFFFFFFNIERSNSVRCNCSCSNPMLMLLFKEGLVRAVLLLLSIFSFIHACRLIIHSCNKAILEQMMLSGHSFNPTRSCEYVIPWHVLVNLATRELDPRSSYSLDKPRGCSHTLCCLSKSKSQNF